MLEREHDTIAAIATPPGVGGVGIIRVSGTAALSIVATLVRRDVDDLDDRRLVYAQMWADDERLDDVLVVAMRGPRSFTGEDVAEIHGHGGAINMARLLRAVVEAGARIAEAGEFTRRALRNERLDLVEAEALLDVIEASSERAWRLAQRQLAGELGATVSMLRQTATDVLAEVEAYIDFPDEGIGEVAADRLVGELKTVIGSIRDLVGSYELGRALRDGIDVALVGRTNAGKSSLFNKLVGSERAIVDEAPGTTRDYVEERIVISGLPVCVIDTAGSRDDSGRVEQKGISLGRRRVETADVVVVMHAAGMPRLDVELGPGQKRIDICSKADLADEANELLAVSSKTGDGIAALRQRVVDIAVGDTSTAETRQVITSERQRNLLVSAADGLQRAQIGLATQPLELVAVDVRDSLTALAEIQGEAVGAEVLDSLFSRFCIGK